MEVSVKKARSPPHIPIEIIRYILMKLKVKALIRFKCVCKEWRSTIEDSDFKLSYRGRRRVLVVASGDNLAVTTITNSLRIETLFPVGENFPLWWDHSWWSGVWCSCNGLVLFSMGKHILLWNPSTRRCAKVLELPRLKGLWDHNFVSGLCYVPSTGDYKAVLLLHREKTVLVASLKNKEWRKVSFPYHIMSVRDGISFNNTLHWRVGDSKGWSLSRRLFKKVVYFEAESDEFKELPTPTFPAESWAILGLGIIDGHLSIAQAKWKGIREVQVLVMKEYGEKKSWVRQFVIPSSQFTSDYYSEFTFYPFKCNTQVVIWSSSYGWWRTLVYDLKNNKLAGNGFQEKGHCTVAICSYVQSFVSPHEFIWKDDQHKPSKKDYFLSFILERFSI